MGDGSTPALSSALASSSSASAPPVNPAFSSVALPPMDDAPTPQVLGSDGVSATPRPDGVTPFLSPERPDGVTPLLSPENVPVILDSAEPVDTTPIESPPMTGDIPTPSGVRDDTVSPIGS